ncbi:MAG: hypothetical protein JJ971_01090 [Balneolaceae bacterium]|nr:hypothetical protein [Balneolaceae bacterium]MBO6544965.1 hypothetical protein [Balneolaceae bacterium]MBO6646361.1 hypothetical protein [Balneolaceae bacterium]
MIENVLTFFGYENTAEGLAYFLISTGAIFILFGAIFFSIKLMDKAGVKRIELTYLKPRFKDKGKVYKHPEPDVNFKFEVFVLLIGSGIVIVGILLLFFGSHFLDLLK